MHFAMAAVPARPLAHSFGRDFANTVSRMITRPGAIQ